jgi:hypothetical protein
VINTDPVCICITDSLCYYILYTIYIDYVHCPHHWETHQLVFGGLIHLDILCSVLVEVALGLGLSAGLDPVKDCGYQKQNLLRQPAPRSG